MHFITPVTVTPAMLVSSSLTESEHPAWNAATTYAVNDLVIYSRTIWKRLTAGTSGTAPSADPANWARVGPTNRWAMFDQATGTASTAASTINFKIKPGMVRALALLDLNANSVTVTMRTGSTVVYTRTASLNTGYGVYDWYTYFFAPIVLKRTMVLDDLPPYSDGEIEVTINGDASTQVGTVVVGGLFEVGQTEYGMQLGMLDYSRKSTDDFGATTVVERAYAKQMTVPVVVRIGDVDEVARQLQLIRAKPVVWIGSTKFDQSVIYGFFKTWSVDIVYDQIANCTLTIEGLT